MTRPIGNAVKVVGTWRLLSIQFEFAGTGECVDMYGANPSGFLILTDGGRLMGIVTAADRTPPKTDADRAVLFESMMAYSGKYRVEGEDKFVTAVDVAWHPGWSGEQARFFELDGEMLTITTAQLSHPLFPGRMGRGVLRWRRS